MPYRPRGPWLWKGRGYYVWLKGRRVNLETADLETAWLKFHQVMAAHGEAPPAPAGSPIPVGELAGRFLDHAKIHLKQGDYQYYLRYLRSFVGAVKRTRIVDSLIPNDLTTWLDADYPNAAGKQYHPKRAIKRVFTWGVAEGLIQKNPFALVKVGKSGRRRGVVTAAQRLAIMASAKDQAFRDLLTILEQTGCRVFEARKVEARHVVKSTAGEHIAWVFPAEEKKRGDANADPRVIPLTKAAGEVSVRLTAIYPTGPLLRNIDGRPWTANAIRCRFRNRRKAAANPRKQDRYGLNGVALPANLCGTLYRKSVATDLSAAGTNTDMIRQIMGHVDLSTTIEHYLQALPMDQLRGLLERVRGEEVTSRGARLRRSKVAEVAGDHPAAARGSRQASAARRTK